MLFSKYMMRLICVTMFLIAFCSTSLHAAQPREAPSWQGTEWINLSQGEKNLDIGDLRGKIVYLSFFQKW